MRCCIAYEGKKWEGRKVGCFVLKPSKILSPFEAAHADRTPQSRVDLPFSGQEDPLLSSPSEERSARLKLMEVWNNGIIKENGLPNSVDWEMQHL